MNPSLSIITPVLNKKETIEATILSVAGQRYAHIEHVVIDGGSTDGTTDIIKKHMDKINLITEDETHGAYEAINKALKVARGEVIGILNADDFYADDRVLEKTATQFEDRSVSALYGDVVYVRKDSPDRVIRHWRSGECAARKFRRGWMPPHPAFFVRKEAYEKFGYFDTNFKIAADYELMVRFLYKFGLRAYYLPEVMVKMRWGGASNGSIRNIIRKTSEDYRVCRKHGMGLFTVAAKNFRKLPQFI